MPIGSDPGLQSYFPGVTAIRRRNFLHRCCQALALAFLRPNLRADSAYLEAGSDQFVTEKYYNAVARILAGLKATKGESISHLLRPEFSGCSLKPSDSKLLRRVGNSIDIYLDRYSQALVSSDVFLRDLYAYFDSFSELQTAEFEVTSISGTPENLHTLVQFQLVGSGDGFYREQRSGVWRMDWRDYKLSRWQVAEQTRTRSAAPCFVEVALHAFSKAGSFSEQLTRGVDYWRTVMDAASGIDIYGHNGVSVADIDGDGFGDLYVCQPAGLPNRLYRNLGDGTFEDITEKSKLGLLDNTSCAIFADFSNKGRQDVVIVRNNGPLLFENKGNGKFSLKPDAFHFATPPKGTFTGAAAADYNRDGLLDIYFCLYAFYQGSGQYNYPLPYYDAENGPPNFLMRNNGDGTFRDATAESGLNQNNTRYSFCCGWGDSNGDGWPDLYVVNDFGRKNLYRNKGDGTFDDVAVQCGVEDVGAGMSVGWLDYDNNGYQDLYVANMWTAAGQRITMQEAFGKINSPQSRVLNRKHAMGNSLLRNVGDGTFQDITAKAGVGMGRWSWSSDVIDFDHDGYADLYIANGMVSGPVREDLNSFFWRQVVANSPDTPKPSSTYEQGWNEINDLIRSDYTWSGYERNVCYANNRDGTFTDVSGAVGLDFLEDGRSFALADFDHDGRQEIFLKNRNGPQLRLLRNVIADLPGSLAIRLRGGSGSNLDAIGAAVTVETAFGKQTKFLQAGSGFLSQHSKELFFGLGEAKGSVSISVRWPSGHVQDFLGIPSDHRVLLEESVPAPLSVEPFRAPAALPRHQEQHSEPLPTDVQTWLVSPLAAPERSRGGFVLLNFNRSHSDWTKRELPFTVVDVSDSNTAAVYNVIYRYLFDRHRDLTLSTSFLINPAGEIVKIYQGTLDLATVERDCKSGKKSALPFPGNSETYESGRNYLTLGSAFFQKGLYLQSQSAFLSAVQNDPDSAEAHYGLGSAYLKLEKVNDAQASFKRAVSMKAGYPDTISNAWNNLGLIATRSGQIETAIGYFKSALNDNPKYTIALLNLGNAYRQQKRWDDARQTLEQLLKLSPEDPEANYSLAMVFAQTDSSEKAYDYLQRALKYRPGYPEALNNLGILYLRTRRRNEAVATFEECIRVAPLFNQAYLNLARIYVLEGDSSKARSLLSDLLKKSPSDALAQRALEQIP